MWAGLQIERASLTVELRWPVRGPVKCNENERGGRAASARRRGERDRRALLGSVEGAADQASAVTGDGRGMSVDCSKGVRMMEARNTKRRASQAFYIPT